MFILEAEYHVNRTEFCLTRNLAELKMPASGGSVRRWTDTRELKGNYILDDEDDLARDVIDIRSSLNRR